MPQVKTIAASDQARYLRAEFRRYFPNASLVSVIINDDESIDVRITGRYVPNGITTWTIDFRMEIGSDDDWYTFRCNEATDYVITIPLGH